MLTMALLSWMTSVAVLLLFLLGNTKADSGQILDDLLRQYDAHTKPSGVNVSIGYYVKEIIKVDERRQEITMSMYFRQAWNDARLTIPSSAGVDKVDVPVGKIDQLWQPDLFFPGARSVELEKDPTDNRLMFIKKNGAVMTSVNLRLTVPCPMNYHKFPLDTQLCGWSIECFGSMAHEVNLNWKDNGTTSDINPGAPSIPPFRVGMLEHKTHVQEFPIGTYKILAMSFKLHRQFGFYFHQFYLPCIFLVVVGYIPCWLDDGHGRLILLLAAILSLCTVSVRSILKINIPDVPYATGIDVYLGCSATFLFISLIQTTMVSWDSSGHDRRRAQLRNEPIRLEETSTSTQEGDSKVTKNKARQVVDKYGPDTLMKMMYPLMFLIFNFGYWLAYA